MQLHVFFSPADLIAVQANPDDIYIVVDLVRATTTLTVLFDSHVSRVFAANTVEQARMAKQLHLSRLLAGERHGLPLADFDYGNSPTQFAELDLGGREVILTTTNGTRAFHACPPQSVRLAGCFYNANAVTTHAFELAQEKRCNINILCAAESNYFALDDATCAGYLILELQRQHPDITLADDVYAALALYNSYAPPKLAEYAHSVQAIRDMNLGRDIEYCMKIDGSRSVPYVVGSEEGTELLVIEGI